jgi:hypothetical protein
MGLTPFPIFYTYIHSVESEFFRFDFFSKFKVSLAIWQE